MSTAVEKEIAASQLRGYASQIESTFDPLPAMSAQAWECPAADAFVQEASAEAGRLRAVSETLRNVAASLDSAAAAQRAAEAAEAAAAAAAAAAAEAAVAGGYPPGVL